MKSLDCKFSSECNVLSFSFTMLLQQVIKEKRRELYDLKNNHSSREECANQINVEENSENIR